MNKQIEEMAKVLCGITKPCKDCRLNSQCLAYNSADVLYNAGYRKASEVAREFFVEIERNIFWIESIYQKIPCLPNGFIAELKKKYEVTNDE